MARTSLQSPEAECEQHSETQKDGASPSMRDLPFPLQEQLEALGFDRTWTSPAASWVSS